MADYVAKFKDQEFQPSDDDIRFAHAFEYITEVIKSTKNSDAVALRLSTCRNAYLTANAIFVDLASILGRGTNPPFFSSIVWYMGKREWAKAEICLYGRNRQSDENGIKPLLVAIEDKFNAWDSREKLDALLREAINKVGKLVIRKELEAILFGDVKTSCSYPVAHDWDRKYYCLDNRAKVDIEIGEVLDYLREAAHILNAIYTIADAAYSYGSSQLAWISNNSLNMRINLPQKWGELFSVIKNNARLIDISSENDTYLFWHNENGQTVEFPQNEPDELNCIFDALLERIRSTVDEVAEKLKKRFKPNLGCPPLPMPFRIDLRPKTLSADIKQKYLELDLSFRGIGPSKNIVTIALVSCNIPKDYYFEYRFANDKYRDDIFRIAKNAIELGAIKNADSLIFPEYFFPRGGQIKELKTLATKKNLILIGGMEGTINNDGILINEAIIHFPEKGDKNYTQEKQWHSIYEPVIKGDGNVCVFSDTQIGNFAIIICCDYVEIPMLKKLSEFKGILHHVFVLTHNPRHELFYQMALADCYRLYAHIAVVNSYPQKVSDTEHIPPTFVCVPTREAKSRSILPDSSEIIKYPDNNLIANVSIYKLPLNDLQGALTESSVEGILTVPRCRRLNIQ